mgnify:CR=1 FL=1
MRPRLLSYSQFGRPSMAPFCSCSLALRSSNHDAGLYAVGHGLVVVESAAQVGVHHEVSAKLAYYLSNVLLRRRSVHLQVQPAEAGGKQVLTATDDAFQLAPVYIAGAHGLSQRAVAKGALRLVVLVYPLFDIEAILKAAGKLPHAYAHAEWVTQRQSQDLRLHVA